MKVWTGHSWDAVREIWQSCTLKWNSLDKTGGQYPGKRVHREGQGNLEGDNWLLPEGRCRGGQVWGQGPAGSMDARHLDKKAVLS